MEKKLYYPQSIEELQKLADNIFRPVADKYCVTCFFVPGTGKRVLVKFLLDEKQIIRNIFGNNFDKTLFIYVDPDEILDVSNEEYLKLMLQNLTLVINDKKIALPKQNADITNPLMLIKKNVEFLVTNGWHVVFLLNDFEFTLHLSPSIFRNLESILALKKNLVTFVFLSTINLLDQSTLEKFHNLKYAINRIVYYHPMMNEKESNATIAFVEKKYQLTLTDDVKQIIRKLCGGHAQLLKYSSTILIEAGETVYNSPEKTKQYLLEFEQLQSVCSDIWNYFTDLEKEILIHVVRTGEIPKNLTNEANYLLKTKVVQLDQKNNKKHRIFGEIFHEFIKSQIPSEKLLYDEKNNQIFLGAFACTNTFTLQEFKLMVHLLKNEGKVISRDEIGQIIWGRNYLDKYSDYSIDKLISSIRKKLEDINFPPYKLTTLKKRGFSFAN